MRGAMLVRAAILLLIAWMFGLFVLYEIGEPLHLGVLVGLLLPLAFAQARDPVRPPPPPDKR